MEERLKRWSSSGQVILHEGKVNGPTVTDILLDTEYSWSMTKHELIEERDMMGVVTIK